MKQILLELVFSGVTSWDVVYLDFDNVYIYRNHSVPYYMYVSFGHKCGRGCTQYGILL